MDDHRLIVADFELLRARTQSGTKDGYNEVLFQRLAKTLEDHFKKEEQRLLPRLNRSLGSTACNKLTSDNAEMLSIARNTPEAASQELFQRLRELLQRHISSEENVLFWYLDVQELANR
jgi:hemerythrin-like domain-containing protein